MNLIKLTKINGATVFVDCKLITIIEAHSEGSFLNSRDVLDIVVKETPEQIIVKMNRQVFETALPNLLKLTKINGAAAFVNPEALEVIEPHADGGSFISIDWGTVAVVKETPQQIGEMLNPHLVGRDA